MDFPPGVRFDPTDQDLCVEYLQKKLLNLPLPCNVIKEVQLYNYHPSELDQLRDKGDEKCYFFTSTRRVSPRGGRPTRIAKNGYWKTTTGDKVRDDRGYVIGMKKTLVFYDGNGKDATKTNWIMHEYKIEGKQRCISEQNNDDPMKLDDWVVCSIYEHLSSREKGKRRRMEEAPTSHSCDNAMNDQEASTPHSCDNAINDEYMDRFNNLYGKDFNTDIIDPLIEVDSWINIDRDF